MSKTIWFVSAPLYSHTDWGGFLKTARVLQAEGHKVLWVSEPRLEPAIRAAELSFHAISNTGWNWSLPPADFEHLPPQEAVALRYRRALDTWLSADLVAQGIHDLLELAAEIGKPDLIATDPFLSAVAFASEKLDVPMVVCGWPAQSNLEADNLFPVQRDLSSDSQQRIQNLCDQFELDGVNFSKGAAPAIISPHLHLLYFTSGWYRADLPYFLPQNQFVGGNSPVSLPAEPDWLQAIPNHVPLALVTLGTTFTGDLGFYAWAAQAAAQHGLLPVVTIGWNPIQPEKKQELLQALPKGTRLLNFVPFEQVLPRTQLMIHHGGMGSTHAAVVHGVPQIVVPHAADQRIQARRVAQARVGLELTAHDVRQGKLVEAVNAIIEADFVQQNATRLAKEMAILGGAISAADLILRLLD